MLPWDLGIINAIKKELQLAIFPSNPSEDLRKTPYLVFELKNIVQGRNLISRVEFSMTIVDNKEVTGASFEIVKTINKIVSKELMLSQDNFIIGSARIKIDSIESKKNHLILNFVAILKLKAIYSDEREPE